MRPDPLREFDDEIDRQLLEAREVIEGLLRRDDLLLADPRIRRLAENCLSAMQDWFDARAGGLEDGEQHGNPTDHG